MALRVDVTDAAVGLLIADIAKAATGIDDRVVDVWRETAGPIILREVKRKVPVDTGALKKSQDFRVNRREVKVSFGPFRRAVNPKSRRPASTYHRYVHDGTSRMPPRPFVRNAINARTTPTGTVMRALAKAGVTPIDRGVIG